MVAAALAVVSMLTAAASAQVAFLDTFDQGIAGITQGHIADTGQQWAGPLFGVASGDLAPSYGQNGTNGAGFAGGGSFMNSVPLNLPANLNPDVDGSGNITGGVWSMSVDFHRDDAAGELQIGLANATIAPGGISVVWLNIGAPCLDEGGNCIQTQGYYTTGNPPDANASIGFTTGDLHIDTIIDFDGAGNVTHKWRNLGTGQKGTIDLGPFTNINFAGDLNTLWYAGNASSGQKGADNLQLFYGVIPEPASMTLLALGGLAMLRRRR
jgi:hypothetical protein